MSRTQSRLKTDWVFLSPFLLFGGFFLLGTLLQLFVEPSCVFELDFVPSEGRAMVRP